MSSNGAEGEVLARRRGVYFLAVLATMLVAVVAMARLLGADGLDVVDLLLLGCFAAMLPWNVIGFWNAVVGFSILCAARDASAYVLPASRTPATGRIAARVALVMPVHNEDPARILRHLEQTIASLDATGEADRFDVFLLSDTQDEALAAAEVAGFDALRWRAASPDRLHYRRRPDNRDQKTGNLWEFLERRGSGFDHMLVLDADSVMSGAAILRQVRIMEAHPEIGILQQLIVGLPNLSPFARIFQFGMRHGMRAYTVGSAWWQGDCGPYWGHNALIRIAPFMAHCRLPELPGPPPLGGRLLSHDQVEAVLMRRAGWEVRALPEETGSYEEHPPTLSDFVKRDLRWCQGNWQYLKLVARPGLHAMGRLQLCLAILMYVSGPAWILFTLVGFGHAIASNLSSADTALDLPAPLFGMPMTWEPWALMAAMMTLVFAPKLAGIAQVLLLRRLRRDAGGGARVLISALVELLFSFVLAPIMAVAQAMFLLGMLAGRTIGWEAQRRDPRSLGWVEAARGFWPQTLLGLILAAAVWSLAVASARPWALLFCGPLVLAVPFAVVTSWTSLGRALARFGICAVPEEVDPPREVVGAGHAIARRSVHGVGGGRPGAVEVPTAPAVD